MRAGVGNALSPSRIVSSKAPDCIVWKPAVTIRHRNTVAATTRGSGHIVVSAIGFTPLFYFYFDDQLSLADMCLTLKFLRRALPHYSELLFIELRWTKDVRRPNLDEKRRSAD